MSKQAILNVNTRLTQIYCNIVTIMLDLTRLDMKNFLSFGEYSWKMYVFIEKYFHVKNCGQMTSSTRFNNERVKIFVLYRKLLPVVKRFNFEFIFSRKSCGKKTNSTMNVLKNFVLYPFHCRTFLLVGEILLFRCLTTLFRYFC